MRNIFLIITLLFIAITAFCQYSESEYISGNLITNVTSYLGGDGEDKANRVCINGNMDIVIGGVFFDVPTARNSYNHLASNNTSKGMVLILEPNTGSLKTIVRIADVVDDMAVDRNDNSIYALGNFGLTKLSSDGSTIFWHKTENNIGNVAVPAIYSSGKRIAVGENGDIAVLEIRALHRIAMELLIF